ncbi:hypothetical protein RQP46_002853 [Phenoliferia psychrophenolica]
MVRFGKNEVQRYGHDAASGEEASDEDEADEEEEEAFGRGDRRTQSKAAADLQLAKAIGRIQQQQLHDVEVEQRPDSRDYAVDNDHQPYREEVEDRRRLEREAHYDASDSEDSDDAAELKLGLQTLLHEGRNGNNRLNGLGLSSDGGEESSLEKRRKESEKRMRALEKEREEIERQGESSKRKRGETEIQLAEARREERTLARHVDDLKRSVADMGDRISAQVSGAVQHTIQVESRKRTTWLAWALVLQVIFLYFVIRIANTRAHAAYEALYFDPFYPALFHPSSSLTLLPETLSLFPPPNSPPFWVGASGFAT